MFLISIFENIFIECILEKDTDEVSVWSQDTVQIAGINVQKSWCINSSVILILRRAYILSLALFWWSFVSSTDFHKAAPYVVTGSVDQTVKVWECRWFGPWRIGPPPQLPRRSSGSHLPSSCHPTSLFSSHLSLFIPPLLLLSPAHHHLLRLHLPPWLFTHRSLWSN